MQSFPQFYLAPLLITIMRLPDAFAGNRTSNSKVMLRPGALGGGKPYNEVLGRKCGDLLMHNTTTFVPKFLSTFENMVEQLEATGFAAAAIDSGPNSPNDTFSLAQCYSNVSSSSCHGCFQDAWNILPATCFPEKATEVFLDRCSIRVDNYSFYQEYSSKDDKVVCGNGTRGNLSFRDVVLKGLSAAIRNNGYSLVQSPLSRSPRESAYVLATCWKPLSNQSCSACLGNASASLSSCLPSSQGFVLSTGCVMRYGTTDFLSNKFEDRSLSGTENRNSKGNKVIIIVASICSVVLVAAVIGVHMWKRRKHQKKRKGANGEEKFAVALLNHSLEYKYSTLKKATGSFDDANRLGQGGFGTVYKGILPDGREIAVKRLFFNNQHRAADVYNEVNIVSSIRHKNLVRLLGCCCSGPESLLVYELLQNGSLDRFIFAPSEGKLLDWEKRLNIIIGTAEGLVYLHKDTETRIVHRDIKASNILLDSKLQPKIADFGLARSFQEDKSHISTAIAGTFGYMAPEYIGHGQITEKADVYSFGVLLLEIVTGRKINKNNPSEYSDNLLTAMWKHFQQGRVQELLDTNLALNGIHEFSIEHHEIVRVVHVALLCTQKMPSFRPSMSAALQMLSRKDEHLPPPTPPPYIDGYELNTGQGDIHNSPSFLPKRGNSASNASVSYTMFYPR